MVAVSEIMEDVYTALENDNEDIDFQIARLKDALAGSGEKEAVFDPARLPQPNRAGRKMMQSYFKKRGVKVTFSS